MGWGLTLPLILVAPWLLALMRARPALLAVAGLAQTALPLAVAADLTPLRFLAGVAVGVGCIKCLMLAAGHVQRGGYLATVLYFYAMADVRCAEPGDLTAAGRGVALAMLQGALGFGLILGAAALPLPRALEVVVKQVEVYLVVAGPANFWVAVARLHCGCDDAFRAPLTARSPGDFWGERWNRFISRVLHRYVFLPTGGRRHPARATLAAFAVSGAIHEWMIYASTRVWCGAMLAYFALQGLAVVVTSGSRGFRRWSTRWPTLSLGATLGFMMLSGWIFIHGLEHAWDFHAEARAWLRRRG